MLHRRCWFPKSKKTPGERCPNKSSEPGGGCGKHKNVDVNIIARIVICEPVGHWHHDHKTEIGQWLMHMEPNTHWILLSSLEEYLSSLEEPVEDDDTDTRVLFIVDHSRAGSIVCNAERLAPLVQAITTNHKSTLLALTLRDVAVYVPHNEVTWPVTVSYRVDLTNPTQPRFVREQ
jgi:hypothetical protein